MTRGDLSRLGLLQQALHRQVLCQGPSRMASVTPIWGRRTGTPITRASRRPRIAATEHPSTPGRWDTREGRVQGSLARECPAEVQNDGGGDLPLSTAGVPNRRYLEPSPRMRYSAGRLCGGHVADVRSRPRRRAS